MIKFEVVKDKFRAHPDVDIKLPTRATEGSAGYDFYTPVGFSIAPGEEVVLKLDVKAAMPKDIVLNMYVRSSIGIKKNLMLMNTVGVIDSDFYNNTKNDGNITLALYNWGNETRIIEPGDRVAQGIFTKVYFTDDDDAHGTRTGGIGSTN